MNSLLSKHLQNFQYKQDTVLGAGIYTFKFFSLYFFILAALGLCCCLRAFSDAVSGRYSSCRAWASSHCSGFSCGIQALGRRLQQWWPTALVAKQHVEFSQTRDQNCILCIGRQTLKHWTTREVRDLPLDARFINKELYIQGRSQIRKEKITYVISDVITEWWGGEPLVQRRLWSVLSKGQVSGKVSRGADA